MEDDGPVHRKACHLFPELSELQFKVQPLWRTVWRFLKKLELELPYGPGIPLLGIHTEESRIETDTCNPMFITALFAVARTYERALESSLDRKEIKPVNLRGNQS